MIDFMCHKVRILALWSILTSHSIHDLATVLDIHVRAPDQLYHR